MSQDIGEISDVLTNLARPRTSATLTLRIIKSFEYRTEKSLVLHDVNLETTTVGDLKRTAIQGLFDPLDELIVRPVVQQRADGRSGGTLLLGRSHERLDVSPRVEVHLDSREISMARQIFISSTRTRSLAHKNTSPSSNVPNDPAAAIASI